MRRDTHRGPKDRGPEDRGPTGPIGSGPQSDAEFTISFTKKTAFGATAATAALVVIGVADPAMASDNTNDSPTRSYSFSTNTEIPVAIAPDVELLNRDSFNALNGGIGDVSEEANGNNVSDTSDVSDMPDRFNVSDVTSNVSGPVGDIPDSVNLDGILGGILGR